MGYYIMASKSVGIFVIWFYDKFAQDISGQRSTYRYSCQHLRGTLRFDRFVKIMAVKNMPEYIKNRQFLTAIIFFCYN